MVVGKFVANSAYGVEINRIFLVRLKIFPERENEIIYSSGGRIYIVVPYRFQDLLAGYRFIPPLDKQLEQHGLLLGQRGNGTVIMLDLK